jgi:hypothetical protein
MAKGLRSRRLDGLPFPHTLLSLSLTGSNLIQGGGILAAFTSFFPDLVDNKVVLIAPTGLVEVSSSILYMHYRTQTTSSLETCQKQLNLCRHLSFNL